MNLNKILRAYHMLTSSQKLHSFIQLSLTLTKLCQIDHDHLVNFYISLEKSASAIRHLGFLKLIFKGSALERHDLHHHAKFCADLFLISV